MKYSALMNKTRSELIELINKFETESNNKSKTIDKLRKRLANKHEIEVSLNSRIEQLQTKSLEIHLTEMLDNVKNLPKYVTVHITNLEDRNNNLVKTIYTLEAKLAERNTEILEIKEALRQHGIVICKI